MKVRVKSDVSSNAFLEDVERLSGQKVKECYQCGKCSGGCPFSFLMDYAPNQILEMVVYGMDSALLKSKAIHVCIGCGTCGANCPAGFELYKVIETLRSLAKKKGFSNPDKSVAQFNEIFLKSVAANGRLHEIGLILQYNLSQKNLFKDAFLGPKMFFKGMLSIKDLQTSQINGTDQVSRLVGKYLDREVSG